MTRAARADGSTDRRVLLLAGQAFALGLMMAWILIPSSAIFLDRYGSGVLPVTYIGAAAAGVVSSAALGAAFRRRPLAVVAERVLAGLAVVLVGSWVLLTTIDAEWVSFGLLVLVPIVVPVGFMFVVGQAGMLLDVRELKALYARVIAGFALGFVAGGLLGRPVLALVGEAEHLVAASAIVACAFLALIVATRRSYPAELSVLDAPGVDEQRPTLRALLRNRYVTLIIGFQVLSAIESQWLDYLVFDRAAGRYDDSRELAQFISRFTAIAYGADIVFLVVLAGVLLRRFGLRYGLTANSLGVLALVGAVVVATTMRDSAATFVFVLIVAARVTDLTFSDGAARASLGAAYQAVPNQLRLAAQATTEGLAVPVAIGASGVVLLVIRSTAGTSGLLLPVLTSTVVAAWVVVAVLVYRGYRANLLANLRHRVLDPAELVVDDLHSAVVIDRLVHSADERDVRLGLDTLAMVGHPELLMRLTRLAADDRPGVRADALQRMARLDLQTAASVARGRVDDPSEPVRVACVNALAGAGEPADLAVIESLASDPSPEVRVAVAVATARLGDDSVRSQLMADLTRMSADPRVSQRIIAARVLAACEPGPWLDRTMLRMLLADDDPDVVNAALAAVRWPCDTALLDAVLGNLHNRPTAGAAVAALARGGEGVLVAVDERLRGDGFGRRGQELLARVCRMVGGGSAAAVLRRHVVHPDREVGLAVMTALAGLGQSGAPDRLPSDRALDASDDDVVLADIEHAAHVLRALVALEGAGESAIHVRAALRDELRLVRQRVLAALSIRHGTEGLSRVAYQFAQTDARSQGLALEWLDVTLTGDDRAVVALLESGLSDRDRSRALARWFPLSPMTAADAVRDLIEDPDARWRRPWITACALYAAASMPAPADGRDWPFDVSSRSEPTADDGIVHETLAAIRSRGLAGT